MPTPTSPTDLASALAVVRARTALVPQVAIVAGSGLDDLATRITDGVALPYAEIPGWPVSTVAGHAGILVVGWLGGRPVAVARGRAHLYEGYAPAEVTYGVRLMAGLGAKSLIITNAAGGLRPDWAPGDVMIIVDHIFLPGLAGLNPLVGPNDDTLGPRFPILRGAYDSALAALASTALRAADLTVREGVYAMVVGPSFETPAEARLLRSLGADVVGMSTAPEVVAARHAGLRVLGLSLITNLVPLAQPGRDEALPREEHAEVLAASAAAAPRLAAAVESVVAAF